MQHQWFSHLPKDKQEEFKKLVLGSEIVLDRLKEICYNIVKSQETVKVPDYDSPSWACKQAHLNGKAEMAREIITLLKINSDKEVR